MNLEEVKTCKKISDYDPIIERLEKSTYKDKDGLLFELRDFYAYYYFHLDDSFYMAQMDDYASSVYPKITFYEITLEQLKKEFEKYKINCKDDKYFNDVVSKTEEKIKIEEPKEEKRIKNVIKNIKSEIDKINAMLSWAKQLNVDSELNISYDSEAYQIDVKVKKKSTIKKDFN